MGLFSKKKDTTPSIPKEELISADKMIKKPPAKYGEAEKLKKVTTEQQSAYKELLTHFQDEKLELPIDTNDTTGKKRPLSSWEKYWLTRECIYRYLRANKWHISNAKKGMTETIIWRREVGIAHGDKIEKPLTGKDVAIENETGKEILLGFDYDRRPLFYMKNGRQNTESSFRQVQQLIYMMESAVTLCPQGVEKITVLVDFKAYKEPGIITDKAPPVSIARACLNVMQNHYPERLAKCVLINIPWFAWAFLKMMYPFLDPATKEKAVFDEPFEKYIEPEQLEALYNGKLDFKYNHEVYWPDMVSGLDEIRHAGYERFLKFGGVIGLSEYDIKGDHDELLYPIDFDQTQVA